MYRNRSRVRSGFSATALIAALAVTGCNWLYDLDATKLRPDDAHPACLSGPFGPGAPVAIEGDHSVEAARFTPNQNLAYLALCPTTAPDPKPECELYTAPFSLETKAFGGASKMTGVSAAGFYDAYPSITSDNQHLLFGSERGGDGVHIFVATTTNGSFDSPTITRLAGPSSMRSNEPYVTGNGRVLYYGGIAGSSRLYRMEGDPPEFGAQPVLVAGVDRMNADEFAPVVREDDLEIFFASGANMALDIYVARRTRTSDAFETPTRVDLSTSGIDWPVWIAPDGCDLYYISKSGPRATLFVARRL